MLGRGMGKHVREDIKWEGWVVKDSVIFIGEWVTSSAREGIEVVQSEWTLGFIFQYNITFLLDLLPSILCDCILLLWGITQLHSLNRLPWWHRFQQNEGTFQTYHWPLGPTKLKVKYRSHHAQMKTKLNVES